MLELRILHLLMTAIKATTAQLVSLAHTQQNIIAPSVTIVLRVVQTQCHVLQGCIRMKWGHGNASLALLDSKLLSLSFHMLHSQICKGDPRTLTPAHVVVSSAIWSSNWGILVLPTVRAESCKQNTSTIFSCHATFMYVYLHAWHAQTTVHAHQTNYGHFDLGKTQIP